MKKSLFCFLGMMVLILIAGNVNAQSVDLSADPEASIKFTTPVQTSGMSFINETSNGAEAYSESAILGGESCRKIPAGKYLYIKCDRSIVPTSQNELIVAITFFDNSSNNLWFNYNSLSGDYKIADFAKTRTNKWITTFINITDASFKGSMNGGGDFRLGFNGEANFIKDISVYLGTFDPVSQAIPQSPKNPASEFKGKSFAGYQIWHRAGKAASDWVHWSYGKIPAAGLGVNVNIVSFPDLSEYPDSVLYTTKFKALGNGRATKLYNSSDKTIIDRQMGWLKNAGLDGVAIQRFVGSIGRAVTITPESHLTNVKNATEANGRLFYICYDLNGSDASIVDRIQLDWVYEIEQIRALTSSPNYATVNGKPVVEMWGIGYNIGADKQQCLEMIQFFQDRGCYVIGGTPRGWRTNSDAMANFTDVYKALDAVSPWTVGVYNTPGGATSYLNDYMKADKTYCDQNGMDYLPVVFPGSGNWLSADGSFSQTDRKGGGLLWQQVLNAKSIGLSSVYYAMLDEFEEGTNLINGAVDYFDIPTDEYFETFAKDGVWTSSDYYLRLAAAAARMLRDDIPKTTDIPVPYSLGPFYYRNSFESRTTTFTQNGTTAKKTMKIDPCFFNPQLKESSGMTGTSVKIVNEPAFAKTGIYSVKISGIALSGIKSVYSYKVADTKIEIKPNLHLTFWKYTVDESGKYTSVDLLFKSGKKLSALPGYSDNNGLAMSPGAGRGTIGDWQKFTCQIGKDELIGDEISGITISYDHPSENGTFNAYFDDIKIEYGEGNGIPTSITNVENDSPIRIYTDNQRIFISDLLPKSQVAVYNLSGQMFWKGNSNSSNIQISAKSGFYMVRILQSGNVISKKVVVP